MDFDSPLAYSVAGYSVEGNDSMVAAGRVGGWGRNYMGVGTAVGGMRENLDSANLDHEPTDHHPPDLLFPYLDLFCLFHPFLPAEPNDMI
jgi:hypothetical protein